MEIVFTMLINRLNISKLLVIGEFPVNGQEFKWFTVFCRINLTTLVELDDDKALLISILLN